MALPPPEEWDATMSTMTPPAIRPLTTEKVQAGDLEAGDFFIDLSGRLCQAADAKSGGHMTRIDVAAPPPARSMFAASDHELVSVHFL